MGATAVLDVGKTNVKLALFEEETLVWSDVRPNRTRPGPPFPHEDADAVWDFSLDALERAGRRHAVDALVVATHGAAAALVDEAGLVLPVMDYEWSGPDAVEDEYSRLRPPFAETYTLPMAGGLNWAKQIFYGQARHPVAFARAKHILTYPQYFAWRFTGAARSEITSLACHGDAWNAAEGRLSSLVERCGWAPLVPPPARAWETLGHPTAAVRARTGLSAQTRVLVGIHDSNASLLPHLLAREPPFTLVSTGTWVVIPAIGAPLTRLDAGADITAGIDVTGRASPVARFMGGREWDVLVGGAAGEGTADDLAAVLRSGVLAAPAFASHTGPFKGRRGRIDGDVPDRPGARAALASLYLALCTDAQLDALGAARGPVIVEGRFAANTLYCAVLAALRPDQPVFAAADTAGTAYGASLLATWPKPPKAGARTLGNPVAPFAPSDPVPPDALFEHRARWREAAGMA